MPTHEWARNSDAIEDVRDDSDIQTFRAAVKWAVSGKQMEADELYEALFDEFQLQGNSNFASCKTNRALEIILDAYLEDRKQEAA